MKKTQNELIYELEVPKLWVNKVSWEVKDARIAKLNHTIRQFISQVAKQFELTEEDLKFNGKK